MFNQSIKLNKLHTNARCGGRRSAKFLLRLWIWEYCSVKKISLLIHPHTRFSNGIRWSCSRQNEQYHESKQNVCKYLPKKMHHNTSYCVMSISTSDMILYIANWKCLIAAIESSIYRRLEMYRMRSYRSTYIWNPLSIASETKHGTQTYTKMVSIIIRIIWA